MNATADLTTETYRDEINSMADDIAGKDDRDERIETISERVDSHKWVIYYDYNSRVVDIAESDPEMWTELVNVQTASYRDVLNAMAYAAMRADLRRAVDERL